MIRSAVAEELERRMTLLGLTQKALARNAGVGDTYVRDILKGKSRNPGGEKLERIAAILGCTARDLLFPLKKMGGQADAVGAQHEPAPTHMGQAERVQPNTAQTKRTPTNRGHSVRAQSEHNAPYAPVADQPEITLHLNPPGYVAVPFISLKAGMGGGGYVEDQLLGKPKFFEEEFVRSTLRATPCDLRVIEVEGQSMEPMLQNGDMVLVDTRRTSIIEPGIFVLFDGDGVVCKWVERAHEASEPMVRIKSENARFSPYCVPAEQVQIIGRVVWFARKL